MSDLEKLFVTNQEDEIRQKLVAKLLDESDMDTKTEIENPFAWACIDLLGNYALENQLPFTAHLFAEIERKTERKMVSNDRKGRSEYIQAINALSANLSKSEEESDP